LELRKEASLVSGMAMPFAFQFGIGFAVARELETSLPATEKMVIVTNRIVGVKKKDSETSTYIPLIIMRSCNSNDNRYDSQLSGVEMKQR
jgi:hypothetical protein